MLRIGNRFFRGTATNAVWLWNNNTRRRQGERTFNHYDGQQLNNIYIYNNLTINIIYIVCVRVKIINIFILYRVGQTDLRDFKMFFYQCFYTCIMGNTFSFLRPKSSVIIYCNFWFSQPTRFCNWSQKFHCALDNFSRYNRNIRLNYHFDVGFLPWFIL